MVIITSTVGSGMSAVLGLLRHLSDAVREGQPQVEAVPLPADQPAGFLLDLDAPPVAERSPGRPATAKLDQPTIDTHVTWFSAAAITRSLEQLLSTAFLAAHFQSLADVPDQVHIAVRPAAPEPLAIACGITRLTRPLIPRAPGALDAAGRFRVGSVAA
ncbi:hypothetical protein [Kitasatospora aureofaciens]|uniref:hypothetical protein n=1 Tax=Kitasatospora aureofaciens TaxID=1894 RepID=UPI0037CA17D9